MENNHIFKSKILRGEKPHLQEQNSPWRKTTSSRAKFSVEKNPIFKSKILRGEKPHLQKQNSPWRKTHIFKSQILREEKPHLQEQNSPWRKPTSSRAKSSVEKNFKSQILRGEKPITAGSSILIACLMLNMMTFHDAL